MPEISANKGHIEPVPVYFDDLDMLGMVHHTRFPILFERGTGVYFARAGLQVGHEDASFFIKSLALTFEQPLTTVGTVDLAFWIETLGRTSAKFGFRFQTGETVYAYGHRTIIKIDPATLRPASWTESTRQMVTNTLLIPAISESTT